MNCPGSIRMIGDDVGTPSRYAREGTALHGLAERSWRERLPASAYVGDVIDEIIIDEDRAEAVAVYTGYLERIVLEDGGELRLEHHFDLGELWPALFGTCDAVHITATTLRIIDAKFGRGHVVDPVNNTQLAIYGVGAYRTLLPELPQTIEWIELVIVQPRAAHRDGPIRTWRMHVTDLWSWQTVLVERLQATLDPDAPLAAGDWCIFCPARDRCPALRDHALAEARMQFGQAPPAPQLLSPQEIAQVLAQVDLVDEWIHAVKAHALALAESGVVLPGWKLVPRRSTRQWKQPEATVPMLRAMGYGDDVIFTEPELRSVRQVELRVPHAKRAELEPLVEKRSSGHNLVASIDVRPGDRPMIESDFSRVEQA
jgi:hypothetical protein